MATSIEVSEFVVNTLKDSVNSGSSDTKILLGRLHAGQVEVVACADCSSLTDDAVDKIKLLLPGGVSLCGLSCTITGPDVTAKDLSKADPIMNHITEHDPVILCCTKNKGDASLSKAGFITSNRTFTEVDLEISSRRLVQDNLIARAKCHIPLSFNLGHKDSWKTALHNEIETLCDEIVSDSTIFHLLSSKVLLCNAGCYGLPKEATCQFLTSCIRDDNEDETDTTKKKNAKAIRHLTFDIYTDLSGECALDQAPSCSPIIIYNIETVKKVNMFLPVDVVSVFYPDTPATEMAATMCQSISNQLQAMEACICQHSKNEKFATPVPYHYQPMDAQTLFTVVYPHGVPEERLETVRRGIQKCLCLPLDRPLFRRANRFVFPDDQEYKGYLVNVHEGLSGSKVSGGTQYLVKGSYTYHHYMQDRFDDNKWGCAYRSLQTLVSWFKLQGYADRDIPNHREVQQTLVDIGDKEANFVGSRQWIGSMEVSFVLDTLIGVTSKILSVSSGAELASKGIELASHFSSQGTPVMIGGGVLAHTILGVDYNEVSGDINFLILDPHYTGSEAIKVILDKGWCGWKGPEFWDQHAHYNMCMPQRPSVI